MGGGDEDDEASVLQDEESHSDTQQQADLSSVITQVTSADAFAGSNGSIAKPAASFSVDAKGGGKGGKAGAWGGKLKTLLCCFSAAGSSSDAICKPRSEWPPTRGFRGNRKQRGFLIGPKISSDTHKKTLVLDLDETLVHSSFKPIPNPDFVVPVEIEGRLVDVYVLKRPRLDEFMEIVGKRFEVVVFTASLGKYADPLLDWMDSKSVVRWRLFREACLPWEGNYVKDLTFLGRDLASTIIVDNSPHSYVFQPENALPVSTFIDDAQDNALMGLLPVLKQLEMAEDVRSVLSQPLKQ